jgi:hypothetical protein
MGRALKIQKQGYAATPGDAVNAGYPQIGTLDNAVTPTGLTDSNYYGIVGGNVQNSQTGWNNGNATMAGGSATFPVITVSANIDGTQNEAAFITRQKGASKFLVTGETSGVTGVAYLANVANGALTVNQMSVGVSVPDGTGNVTVTYMSRINNKYGVGFSTADQVDGVIVNNNATQYFLNFFDPAGNITLGTTTVTGNAGTFSTVATTILANAPIIVAGNLTGNATLVGYSDPTTYFVTTTNGTSTFTLSDTVGGANIVTTAGNTRGLTFTVGSLPISVVKSGADAITFTDSVGNITMAKVPSNP